MGFGFRVVFFRIIIDLSVHVLDLPVVEVVDVHAFAVALPPPMRDVVPAARVPEGVRVSVSIGVLGRVEG